MAERFVTVHVQVKTAVEQAGVNAALEQLKHIRDAFQKPLTLAGNFSEVEKLTKILERQSNALHEIEIIERRISEFRQSDDAARSTQAHTQALKEQAAVLRDIARLQGRAYGVPTHVAQPNESGLGPNLTTAERQQYRRGNEWQKQELLIKSHGGRTVAQEVASMGGLRPEDIQHYESKLREEIGGRIPKSLTAAPGKGLEIGKIAQQIEGQLGQEFDPQQLINAIITHEPLIEQGNFYQRQAEIAQQKHAAAQPPSGGSWVPWEETPTPKPIEAPKPTVTPTPLPKASLHPIADIDKKRLIEAQEQESRERDIRVAEQMLGFQENKPSESLSQFGDLQKLLHWPTPTIGQAPKGFQPGMMGENPNQLVNRLRAKMGYAEAQNIRDFVESYSATPERVTARALRGLGPEDTRSPVIGELKSREAEFRKVHAKLLEQDYGLEMGIPALEHNDPSLSKSGRWMPPTGSASGSFNLLAEESTAKSVITQADRQREFASIQEEIARKRLEQDRGKMSVEDVKALMARTGMKIQLGGGQMGLGSGGFVDETGGGGPYRPPIELFERERHASRLRSRVLDRPEEIDLEANKVYSEKRYFETDNGKADLAERVRLTRQLVIEEQRLQITRLELLRDSFKEPEFNTMLRDQVRLRREAARTDRMAGRMELRAEYGPIGGRLIGLSQDLDKFAQSTRQIAILGTAAGAAIAAMTASADPLAFSTFTAQTRLLGITIGGEFTQYMNRASMSLSVLREYIRNMDPDTRSAVAGWIKLGAGITGVVVAARVLSPLLRTAGQALGFFAQHSTLTRIGLVGAGVGYLANQFGVLQPVLDYTGQKLESLNTSVMRNVAINGLETAALAYLFRGMGNVGTQARASASSFQQLQVGIMSTAATTAQGVSGFSKLRGAVTGVSSAMAGLVLNNPVSWAIIAAGAAMTVANAFNQANEAVATASERRSARARDVLGRVGRGGMPTREDLRAVVPPAVLYELQNQQARGGFSAEALRQDEIQRQLNRARENMARLAGRGEAGAMNPLDTDFGEAQRRAARNRTIMEVELERIENLPAGRRDRVRREFVEGMAHIQGGQLTEGMIAQLNRFGPTLAERFTTGRATTVEERRHIAGVLSQEQVVDRLQALIVSLRALQGPAGTGNLFGATRAEQMFSRMNQQQRAGAGVLFDWNFQARQVQTAADVHDLIQQESIKSPAQLRIMEEQLRNARATLEFFQGMGATMTEGPNSFMGLLQELVRIWQNNPTGAQ